jgi:hypothetical protein
LAIEYLKRAAYARNENGDIPKERYSTDGAKREKFGPVQRVTSMQGIVQFIVLLEKNFE